MRAHTEAGPSENLTKQNKRDGPELDSDNKQTSSGAEDEVAATQQIIKFTRKNLRPVQPFQRTGSQETEALSQIVEFVVQCHPRISGFQYIAEG